MNLKVTDQETNNTGRELLTEKEVAQRYCLSLVTLYRARKKKKLAFYQVGRKILYSKQHIQNYLINCEENASSN